MIVVKLKGGLGNQMFQYAVARRLAHTVGSGLKLDVSELVCCNLREYSLGVYKIAEDILSSAETLTLTSSAYKHLINSIFSRIIKRTDRILLLVKENNFSFDSKIVNLKDDVFLDGYWQSEKYFFDIADMIREEFSLKDSPTKKTLELSKEIASCEAVSVHIRRGDYVSNPAAHKILGLCDVEYYKKSIALLKEKVRVPRFFVFSDDPEWVGNNFDIGLDYTQVTHNGSEQSHEDMYLMSLCKHHIIANSSFSWWGAWLCSNKAKTVIAPKRWFRDSSVDTSDLIPEPWLRI